MYIFLHLFQIQISYWLIKLQNLVCVALVFFPLDETYASGFNCYVSSDTSSRRYIASDHFKFTFSSSISAYVCDSDGNNPKVSANKSCNYIANSSGAFLQAPKIDICPWYFFIEKDQKLYIKSESEVNAGDGTDYSCTLTSLIGTGYSYYILKVKDVSVY